MLSCLLSGVVTEFSNAYAPLIVFSGVVAIIRARAFLFLVYFVFCLVVK